MLTPDQWAVIQDLGTAGLLAFALVGGWKGIYVWRWQYRAIEADRDFWRSMALRTANTAEAAVSKLPEKPDA